MKNPKNNEDDYDFDFSEYEEEEQKSEDLSTTKQKKKPITGLRSKFSPSSMELDSLQDIKNKISEYSIKVASRTTELSDLWTLYGCLNEYWSKIHDIFGTIIINEIKHIDQTCYTQLNNIKNNEIPEKIYKNLLVYRNTIYKIAQRANLGLDVEKSSFSQYDKAKKGMVE